MEARALAEKNLGGEGAIRMEPILTTKDEFFWNSAGLENPNALLPGPEPFLWIIISTANYHRESFKVDYLQYICYFTKKTNLQYSAIIRINLFESNKNFTLAVIILRHKLLVNMYKFLSQQNC